MTKLRKILDDHVRMAHCPNVVSDALWAINDALDDQSGWQPMETAPKDGTEVLLVVERRAGTRWGMLVGHYMPGGHCIEDHPPIDSGWYFWQGSRFDKAAKPTHWMALPVAPEEE